uniref:Uncharacterized protein n=2 Tax=Bos indicus x Bos taurus TaxID=30522 RepID=A0A4W2DFM7_BOBOX
MGGGWWWARAARLARLRFRGALLPPPRPRSGSARGSFAPGHGPRAGASPPPVSELDRADAWLLRKAHETAFLSWFRNGLIQNYKKKKKKKNFTVDMKIPTCIFYHY